MKNSNSEYEKDILKAIMAKSCDYDVGKLIFICKPGGVKKCDSPSRLAMKEWLRKSHQIELEVIDL